MLQVVTLRLGRARSCPGTLEESLAAALALD